MFFVELGIFLLLGLLSGVLAGLLGIGGGVVLIPALLAIFKWLGIPHSDLMQLAVGTSLAAMVFTTLSSSISYLKKKNVIFSIALPMGSGIIFGTLLGAWLTKILSSDFLQIFFAIFEVLIGIRFLLKEKPVVHFRPLPPPWGLSCIGMGVSTLATMLGVGGGLINVPILTYFHVPLKQAIATSSALSFVISCTGAIFFLLMRRNHTPLPESMGYIYLPAFIIISLFSFITAPYGVKLAHYLPKATLKRVFGVVLIIAGVMVVFT